MRVLVAPSGFKECLDADRVAEEIATGVLRAVPDAHVAKSPLVDGGEGFTRALVAATGGELHGRTVTGPVGGPVASHFGFLGGPGPRTAVVEMAAAAGLALVPADRRDPLRTTTRGVGELIAAALDAGAERILLGCGDSGTNDGGAGMAQALGVSLRDRTGAELEQGGAALSRLQAIDRSSTHPRLGQVTIDAACNVHNVLCGADGVARVFGPQKGASERDVAVLERALERYAAVVEDQYGVDARSMPGGGASGGLGTGLHVLLGGQLHPRYDIVLRYLDFDSQLDRADLVLTAEGGLDFQTPRGKIPAEVARRASRRGIPTIALAGTIGEHPGANYDAGIDAFSSIVRGPCALEEAIAAAPRMLRHTAEATMRMVAVGQALSR